LQFAKKKTVIIEQFFNFFSRNFLIIIVDFNFYSSVGDFNGLHHPCNWQFRFGVAKKSMFLALLDADPTSDRGFLFGWPDLSQNEPSFARVSLILTWI